MRDGLALRVINPGPAHLTAAGVEADQARAAGELLLRGGLRLALEHGLLLAGELVLLILLLNPLLGHLHIALAGGELVLVRGVLPRVAGQGRHQGGIVVIDDNGHGFSK